MLYDPPAPDPRPPAGTAAAARHADAGTPPHAAPDRCCRLPHGFLYASSRLHTGTTRRPSGALLLALQPGQPFTLQLAGQRLVATAALVRPLVARALQARGVPLLSLNLHPTHADFPRWLALPAPGVQALPAEAFAHLTAELRGFAEGRLGWCASAGLFDALTGALDGLLPPAPAPHPWRAPLLQALQAAPQASLAELAATLGLSYHRLAHLFSPALGMGVREWRVFARAHQAGGRFKDAGTLTGIAHDAGYADSAHLSRTWQRTYGLTPSYLRHDNSVQVIR